MTQRGWLILSALLFWGLAPILASAQERAEGLSSPSSAEEVSSERDPSSIPRGYLAGPEYAIQAPERTQHSSHDPMRHRMSILENHLRALTAEARGGVSNAIFGIVGGGLSITLATYIEDPGSSAYLYLSGGAAAANAIASLALRPDPVEDSIRITQMPMASSEQLRRRVEAGETALEAIASRYRILRLIDGTTAVALGAAVVPIFARSNDFRLDDSLDFIIVAGALTSVVTGIIRLVSSSPAERRWRTYQALRGASDTRSAGSSPGLHPGVFVTPAGGGVSFGSRF